MRGVVAAVLSGTDRHIGGLENGFMEMQFADGGAKHFHRDSAGTKHGGRVAGDVENGGFQADLARSAVENERDASGEFRHHVSGGRWACESGAIGGWRSDGAAECAEERGGDGMLWAAEGNSVATCGNERRNRGTARQDHRKRSGPEGISELLCESRPVSCALPCIVRIADVNDDRIAGRTALGSINFSDGVLAPRICTEPINSFCGKSDEFTGAEIFHG